MDLRQDTSTYFFVIGGKGKTSNASYLLGVLFHMGGILNLKDCHLLVLFIHKSGTVCSSNASGRRYVWERDGSWIELGQPDQRLRKVALEDQPSWDYVKEFFFSILELLAGFSFFMRCSARWSKLLISESSSGFQSSLRSMVRARGIAMISLASIQQIRSVVSDIYWRTIYLSGMLCNTSTVLVYTRICTILGYAPLGLGLTTQIW